MLKKWLWLSLMVLALPVWAQEFVIEAPSLVLRDVPFTVQVRAKAPAEEGALPVARELEVDGRRFPLVANEDGWIAADVHASKLGAVSLVVVADDRDAASATTRSLPGWVSLLPPLLAILIALVSKRVVPALFVGVWFGAWMLQSFSIKGLWMGLLDSFQVYVLNAFADKDHGAVILFSLMIGGMVGIISKNGGMQGVVDIIIKWARSPRRGQLAASGLGLAIFFDDYANTLVVGNTMRPVTDRLRISREKLAYIVDSTAAPVACLGLVTTWVGYQVGLIDSARAKLEGIAESGYSIFIQSVAFSFYPILAIVLVLLVGIMGRDFGPMLAAERRCRAGDDKASSGALDIPEDKDLEPIQGKPHRAVNAVLPVAALILGVLGGLYFTGNHGHGETLRETIGSADSYKSLMWGSLLGVMVAAAVSISQRILTMNQVLESWFAGLKAMLFAMIILLLAWSLSAVTDGLHTADFLVSILGDAIPVGLIPALVMVLAAATAFATGSSWGTMAILMPLVVPLVWAILGAKGIADPAHYYLLHSSISCVLAGSVWGDHCSPISDTTILSSMASGCDHIEHVRTQLPYALSVGALALLVGTIPTGFGFPWWLSLLIGVAAVYLMLRIFGKRVEVSS